MIIATILCTLFNNYFFSAVFPDYLKVIEILPIYKKGYVTEPTNYRPISLLSQFDKMFEKIIYERLLNHIEKNKLLSKFQFGFRQSSSTILAVSKLYDTLINNIDNDLYTCCLFLDLSKAFDTVYHSILLNKLHNYFGVRGIAHDLFLSYLNNRFQYTKRANSKSSLIKVTCGVPQGSCLGPLLMS